MYGDAHKSRSKRRLALLVVLVLVIGLPFIRMGILSPRIHPLNPPPPPGDLLWSADQETGNLSQWTQGQFGEAVFNTGSGDIAITSDVAHSGTHALKLSISGANGTTQAARLLRWNDNPIEGYYSVWFDFPQVYRPAEWWNVFQFKSMGAENDPMWVLNIGNRPDGSMFFYLWDALTQTSYSPLNHVDVSPQQWTEVTAYYRRATDRTGRITIWQNGTLIFDVDQVQTAIANNVHWGIGNYTDNISPSDATIYADDAEIHTVAHPQSP
ncbi:MAG TPA: heparin lyase I family protein [Nitrolancea sp.]|nr:heparin lyase I family protein [Nitrolancea sp.]